jgi:hypothetical protein
MSNHDRFIRRTKDKIGRAGIPTFIGGIDWSFNEVKDKNRKRWSRHVHGVIPDGDPDTIRKRLKKHFPDSRGRSQTCLRRTLGWRSQGSALSREATDQTADQLHGHTLRQEIRQAPDVS